MIRFFLILLLIPGCTLIYSDTGTSGHGDGSIDSSQVYDAGPGGIDGAPVIITDASPPIDSPGECGLYGGTCPEGKACYWIGIAQWGNCETIGDRSEGENCTAQSQCKEDFICTESTCRRLCQSIGSCAFSGSQGTCQVIAEDESESVRACLP